MANAPEGYNANDYPPFAVTADINIFTVRNGGLYIALVRRRDDPFKGSWALPGGFCGINESVEEAARRELNEETGIESADFYMEQVKTYSTPDRDPRMRVVSVAFAALVPNLPDPVAGDDAAEARLWLVEDVLSDEFELAFDHRQIITDALERVRSKIEYTTIATSFLEEPFTLGELYKVYVAVWSRNPDLGNWRRKVTGTDGFVEEYVEDDGDALKTDGGAGRPPMLFKAGGGSVIFPPMKRPEA